MDDDRAECEKLQHNRADYTRHSQAELQKLNAERKERTQRSRAHIQHLNTEQISSLTSKNEIQRPMALEAEHKASIQPFKDRLLEFCAEGGGTAKQAAELLADIGQLDGACSCRASRAGDLEG
ncbi:hypothetical protein MMC30_003652 [Trapelia coarctata]|nr:hypothetical protein [Trapelia coarctata]